MNTDFIAFIYDSAWQISAVSAYLLGSIPTGLLISKFFLGYDIRERGSKNIGMTNVIRTGGKLPGAFTFIGDMLKGAAAVWLYRCLADNPAGLAEATVAVLAVIGHTRSVFLKLTGGKGVATYMGIWLALDYRVALVGMLTWLVCYKFTGLSSVGSLSALLTVAVALFFLQAPPALFLLALVLAVYITILHKDNIRRIIKGEETAMRKSPDNKK